MKLRIWISLLLAAILTAPGALNAASSKRIGMWVWSNSAFSTDQARQKLLRFCLKHRISHLDLYINMSGDEKNPSLQDAEALRETIRLAGLNNISTSALRGSPKMFFAENHQRTLNELRAIIAFYKTIPADSMFRGVKYDVEPYRTKEWKAKGESRKSVMLDYLTFLTKARSMIYEDAPGLRLAVDTPFWWDKDELAIDFKGNTKRFSEHVQDLTDFIVIMSYRRNVKRVLECVENERNYAMRINKVIYPSLETVELEQDSHVSFWESPSRVFWEVVPQLFETAKRDPAMGGVRLHCYRSLAAKFNDEDTDSARPDVPIIVNAR